jgi:replicative DNA helicase
MTHKNGNGNGKNKDLLQPHNLEAESALLGSILIDHDAIVDLSFLQSGDFFIERNAWIYQGLKELHEKRTPADLVTLCDLLQQQGRLDEIGGAAYLSGLISATPTSIHAEYYARIVERDAIKRRYLDTAAKIAKLAYECDEPEELLGKAESLLLAAVDSRVEDKTRFMGDLANMVYDHIERVKQAGGITGIPTGLTDLDKLLGGLQRSDLVVMAGRPGMGKTSLAMQIAKNAAKNHGKKSLFFSLEMGKEQLAQRVVSSETGIEVNRLRTGNIRDGEWELFFKAQKAMSEYPIAVDDTPGLSPSQLRSKAIRHQARYGLDLVVVDYVQLMASDHREQNRHQEISIISRACKVLARELNIPVILLSQLSREVERRRDKRPMLSDLRESGAIEADADIVLFIYRDEVYNEKAIPGVAEIIIAKHRSGPTGFISSFFKKQTTEFIDIAVRVQKFDQVD